MYVGLGLGLEFRCDCIVYFFYFFFSRAFQAVAIFKRERFGGNLQADKTIADKKKKNEYYIGI